MSKGVEPPSFGPQVRDVTCPLLVRCGHREVLREEVRPHGQVMFRVRRRLAFACRFRSKGLTAKARAHRLSVQGIAGLLEIRRGAP